MSQTIYDLTQPFEMLLNLMQSGDIDEETYQDTIASLDLSDIENKVDSYIYVMDELKASSERIKSEEKRLADRRKSQEKNLKKLKETLLDVMKVTSKEKLKTDKYTVWTQNSPVSIQIKDEENIPKQFYEEQAPKLNKKALKDYLIEHENEEIEGVELSQSEGIRYR